MTSLPELSVALATPGNHDTLRRVLGHLEAQTARNRLELVIVAPSREALGGDLGDLEGFWGHRLVEIGPIRSIAQANAAAVRAARAPVVAFAEDHSFPEPGWAAALIAAHQGPWAAVGPEVINANPSSRVSWCDFLVGYGPWMAPAARQPVPFLPGHNSSYKRAILLQYAERLEAMLEAETVLHYDLVAQGHRLLLEPEARIAHTNFSIPSTWLRVMVLQGRVFAASRSRSWRPGRRLAWGAGSPLIPLVRLTRCLRQLGRRRPTGPSVFSLLPILALGLVCDGLGQMVGYLLGEGAASSSLAAYEFRRWRHVTEADREAALGAVP